MIVKVLQAGHGDALIIEIACENSKTFRILIDGGPLKCFQKNNGPIKGPGPLRKELDSLLYKGEHFDLTILTHVDDDHIGGLLKACECEKYRKIIMNEVWFNSGRLIANMLGDCMNSGDLDEEITMCTSRLTSIAQGVSFDDIVNEHIVKKRKLIMAGDKVEFGGITIWVLSPTEDQLRTLLEKWEREKPDSLTSSVSNDYSNTLEELRKGDKEFVEDSSIHNASSISILIEGGGKKALFLGDALPSTICKSLNALGYSKEDPLEVSLCKLSHHGSKANTNYEFLSMIKCDKFIISTDGLRHGLPNKVTLGRIIASSPESEILFNYPGLIDEIFKLDEVNFLRNKLKGIQEDIKL